MIENKEGGNAELNAAERDAFNENDSDTKNRRSSYKIDRTTWTLLFTLSKSHPWLEDRQPELFDLMDLCDDTPQQLLIANLLSRFFYVNNKMLALYCTEIAKQIVEVWGLHPEKTKIIAINRSKYSDSSQAILWLLKSKISAYDGWSGINLYSKLSEAVECAEDGSDLVLLDEFSGTGVTMRKALQWVGSAAEKNELKCTIRGCVVAAMADALLEINKSGKVLFACATLEKGISGHFSGIELEDAVNNMKALESKLCDEAENGTLKKFLCGYKRSESLYYLENGNLPNNVFPIFWWKWLKPRTLRRPLLRRLA